MVDIDSFRFAQSLPENKLTVRDDLPAAVCGHCGEPVRSGEPTATQDDCTAHLECFFPRYRVPISPAAVDISVSTENSARVDRWLTHYNESFRTVSLPLALKSAVSTPRDRCLLESFQYCSVYECVCVLPLVCSSWRDHCMDAEVWTALWNRSFPQAELSEDPRIGYIARCYLACYGCGSRVSPGVIAAMKHPISRQPLCADCFPLLKYHQVLRKTYSDYLGVEENYLDRSGTRTFQYNRKTYVLPYEAREKVCEFRKKRFQEVCEAVGQTTTSTYMQGLDIGKIRSREEVIETIVRAPSDQTKRHIRYIFCEDSVPLASLLIVAPNRNVRRRFCVYPSQLPQKVVKTQESAENSQ